MEIRVVSLFSCALKHEKVDEVIDFCHGLIWVKGLFSNQKVRNPMTVHEISCISIIQH